MVVDAILQWNCAKKITLPVSQALPQPFFYHSITPAFCVRIATQVVIFRVVCTCAW